jgi:sec-independent protein translocase protein TatC
MKASLLVGLFASLPVVLYQVVMFAAPGLTPKEKRYLYILLPVSLLAFAGGAAFGYRILFPPAVDFLLSFGSDVATPYIRIGSYVGLMLSLLFWMGIVFETPVVLFFLSKIGVVTPEFLARHRRFAIVIAFILGAMITPTFDPINQAFVAVPIIVLYEVGIWLAKLGRRGRERTASEVS